MNVEINFSFSCKTIRRRSQEDDQKNKTEGKERRRVVVVIGTTGVGKSQLAVEICERFGGEVINCDSMQVYKHLSIATNRPTESEQHSVPHHLFGFVDESLSSSSSSSSSSRHQDFSVDKFVPLATSIVCPSLCCRR